MRDISFSSLKCLVAVIVLHILVATTALFPTDAAQGDETNESLYNGISLPKIWPPQYQTLEQTRNVPYLQERPKVVNIDVGRQLFVDDFLIENTTLTPTYHRAVRYPGNPVLRPDKEWEMDDESPTAMPFSDGVFFDPRDGLFKMWYMGGLTTSTCYATSHDGLSWSKPLQDVVPNTNIVDAAPRDSASVWLDLKTKLPEERYKRLVYTLPYTNTRFQLGTSNDGIHWKSVAESADFGRQDRHTFFYNPFRDVWVASIRSKIGQTRIRRYHESRKFAEIGAWSSEPVLWCGADDRDKRRMELTDVPDLYALDCVPYESLMVGLFCVWHGQTLDRAKPNDIALGFSRDGFHWHRPDRNPLITVSEKAGDWNWGNVQPVGGCFLVVGDHLFIYFSGRQGKPGTATSGVSSTGLATLRRDGFVSMDAGPEFGELTTRPIEFSGGFMFVNADAAKGELIAEVADESGAAIEPFTFENCIPVRGDSTRAAVRWRGGENLSQLKGRPVRVRFKLRNGQLYSFWVSANENGASNGYVAAGGPEFSGSTDTRGTDLSP